MPTVLLVGTLDTKGDELAFVAARLRDAGVGVLVADAGTVGAPHGVEPDITREELAAEQATMEQLACVPAPADVQDAAAIYGGRPKRADPRCR